MKSIKVLIVLALVATCGSTLWAGDFAIFGSYWNTQDLDEGIGGGIKWGNQLGQSNWDFDSRATYFPDLEGDPGDFDFEFSAIPVEIGVSYNFANPGAANFYLGAGLGWYFLNSDEGHVDDQLGWYAVGGFEAGPDTGAAFMAELIYRQMEASVEGVSEPGNPTVESDVDVDLNGLGANVGVVFRW